MFCQHLWLWNTMHGREHLVMHNVFFKWWSFYVLVFYIFYKYGMENQVLSALLSVYKLIRAVAYLTSICKVSADSVLKKMTAVFTKGSENILSRKVILFSGIGEKIFKATHIVSRAVNSNGARCDVKYQHICAFNSTKCFL